MYDKPITGPITKINCRQVWKNAQCVQLTLGGRQLGCHGLVIPNAAYNRIPYLVAFNDSINTGVFTPATHKDIVTYISATTDPISDYDIVTKNIVNDERKRHCNEFQGVEAIFCF